MGEALAEAVLSGRCKGLYFIYFFLKKNMKEASAEGLFCQVAAKFLCICMYLKETKTKTPQQRWGCQITPSKICIQCKKKKQRWGCQIMPSKRCCQSTIRSSVAASPLRQTRSYHRLFFFKNKQNTKRTQKKKSWIKL